MPPEDQMLSFFGIPQLSYGTKRCAVMGCPKMMVDLWETNICEDHPSRIVEGEPEIVGEGPTEYVAAEVERSLFWAVVHRYVPHKKIIWETPKYEVWYDSETGEKMGKRL